MLISHLTMTSCWLTTALARGVSPSLSWIICNGGSDSDLQFLYSWISHWLNSRWPFEHDQWNAVWPSLSGDKIKELLSDEFNSFKRTEAFSVSPFAAAWWSTLSCCLLRVFIQSGSMLISHLTMTKCWKATALARGVYPSLFWAICNGGSDSDWQFLYSWINHWLNSRWPFEHDQLNAVMPFLSGHEINEFFSDEFNDFKRAEAISVLPNAARWWNTVLSFLYIVFIQSGSMLTSQLTMSTLWLSTAIERGVAPLLSTAIVCSSRWLVPFDLCRSRKYWSSFKWPQKAARTNGELIISLAFAGRDFAQKLLKIWAVWAVF